MITHVPIFAHPNPKKVLVIGGGDGGVLREVLKHPDVSKITLVEIDDLVIQLSKKYLPKMAVALDNERVEVKLMDGFKYLADLKDSADEEKYDVIITDSSDPDGPAEAFFEQNYFELLNNALNKTGIVISMASENMWLTIENLQKLRRICAKVFPVVKTCYVTIPTYTSGQISLMCCSKNPDLKLNEPVRKLTKEEELKNFKYYNSEIHKASFVLPTWANEIIYKD
ncbi:unnamed protein product [Ambrosiozyma monospora]|uniref:Unnamed protein product n=1 Tax=Ambrosiozyma monospora TaxID=43982 RepID=A0ACB5U4V3_AMBMO|nr:unnamed protein product [Ambrosiozyma monospora]